MYHWCPTCGTFSHHGPGSLHWALRCPDCGTVAAQCPHRGVDLPPVPGGAAGEVVRVVGAASADVERPTPPDPTEVERPALKRAARKRSG